MEQMGLPVLIAPAVIYLVAFILYGTFFKRQDEHIGRLATATLAAAVLLHTFVAGMFTVELGQLPFVGTPAVISSFVWLLAVAYLYTEMVTDDRCLGVFITLILAALQTLSSFGDGARELSPALNTVWFNVHVVSLLLAYVAFAMAFVVGTSYVLLFRELKSAKIGFFAERLPSLQFIDGMNQKAVVIGWLFLTSGLVVGAIWLSQLQPHTIGPKAQAMSLLDPKIFMVVLNWLVYSFAIYARQVVGWTGKRAAWLSAVGFAMVLFNLVPVGYFLTASHNF